MLLASWGWPSVPHSLHCPFTVPSLPLGFSTCGCTETEFLIFETLSVINVHGSPRSWAGLVVLSWAGLCLPAHIPNQDWAPLGAFCPVLLKLFWAGQEGFVLWEVALGIFPEGAQVPLSLPRAGIALGCSQQCLHVLPVEWGGFWWLQRGQTRNARGFPSAVSCRCSLGLTPALCSPLTNFSGAGDVSAVFLSLRSLSLLLSYWLIISIYPVWYQRSVIPISTDEKIIKILLIKRISR